MLQYFFGIKLKQWTDGAFYLPISGASGPVFQDWVHLILPAITLASVSTAYAARIMRSQLLEVQGQDYVRTAFAKGLSAPAVLWSHAMKNALIPVVTFIGLDLGAMLSGAILTETVFNWPGVGSTIYRAIGQRDYPVVFGGVTLMLFAVLIVNLLVDISYAFLDPRIRYGATGGGVMRMSDRPRGRRARRRLPPRRTPATPAAAEPRPAGRRGEAPRAGAQPHAVGRRVVPPAAQQARARRRSAGSSSSIARRGHRRPVGAAARSASPTPSTRRRSPRTRCSRRRPQHPFGTDDLGRDIVLARHLRRAHLAHRRHRSPCASRVRHRPDARRALRLLRRACSTRSSCGSPTCSSRSRTSCSRSCCSSVLPGVAGIWPVILTIGLLGWPTIARVFRSSILSVKENDYVDAGRALGAERLAAHHPPHHAERDRADHRVRDDVDRRRDPHRGGAVLPRPRHPAARRRRGAA